MKSFIKKTLVILVTLLISLSAVSCFDEEEKAEAGSTSTTSATTAGLVDYSKRLVLFENGSSEHVIVIPPMKDCPAAADAAAKLNSAIYKEFDIFLTTNEHSVEESSYEIVIGPTNRYSPFIKLELNQYLIRVENEKVIILGGGNKAILLAVEEFIDVYLVKDANGKLSLPSDLSVRKTVDMSLVYEEPETVVTVATFNIANGRECDHDFSILAEDIVESGAAIVGLQEVDQNTVRNKKQDTMKILSENTGLKYYAYAKALDHQGGEYGNGILSKYPIVSYEAIYLPESKNPQHDEELRVVLHAIINVEGTEVDFFVTHLEQIPSNQQMIAINEHTRESDAFMILGDFNRTPDSGIFENIKNSYIVNTTKILPGTTVDGYDFDNIVLYDEMETRNTRIIKTGHSDHYMLLTDWIL